MNKQIAVEIKPMDTGRLETELAIKQGADIIVVPLIAPLSTIKECAETAKSYNKKLYLDTECAQIFGDRKEEIIKKICKQYDFIPALPENILIIKGYQFKERGCGIVNALRQKYFGKIMCADLKTISEADKEFNIAFKEGADIACIIGATNDEEIIKAVDIAHRYNRKVMADLIGLRDYLGEKGLIKRAKELERLGVDIVCYHIPIDDQVRGEKVPPESVRRIVNRLNIPVAVAGGINQKTALNLVKAGASIIIVGGAITKAENPKKVAKLIREKISSSSLKRDNSYLALDILSLYLKNQVLPKLDSEKTFEFYKLILDTMKNGNHIFYTAAGRSAKAANMFEIVLNLFARDFYKRRRVCEGYSTEDYFPPLRDRDLLIAVTGSGKTWSVNAALELSRLTRKIKIGALTANKSAEIWKEIKPDLIIEFPARTKLKTPATYEEYKEELKFKRALPLGSSFEIASGVYLLGIVEALWNECKTPFSTFSTCFFIHYFYFNGTCRNLYYFVLV